MALPVGKTITLGSGIRTGVAPGQSQYGVGSGQKVRVINTRRVGGQLYYDIQHIGGGTGWVPATMLERAASSPPPSKKTTQSKAVDPKKLFEDSINKQLDLFKKRVGEFNAKNPFDFDEELARQRELVAKDPEVTGYYDQKLSDFLQGIETQRGRSVEDEQNLLADLKADTESYTGRAKLELDRAINASREGFSDAGLFFSGRRLGAEGRLREEEQFGTGEFLRQQGIREREGRLLGARTREDLSTQKRIGEQDISREKAFDIKSIGAERAEKAQRERKLEQLQFIGPDVIGLERYLDLDQQMLGKLI